MAETTKKTVAKETTEPAVKKPTSKLATKKTTSDAKKPVTVKVQTHKIAKKVSFDVTLPKSVFGLTKVKNRGEVSGTGKKPWAQKGTGNARAGSMRSPIFVGGGRVFGPTTARNYNLKVNKKVRRNALLSVLSQLASDKAVLVHEFELKAPSTRDLLIQLAKKNLAELNNVLVVTNDENIYLSARNLPNVHVTKITSLSVESLLAADVLVLSAADVKYLEGMVK